MHSWLYEPNYRISKRNDKKNEKLCYWSVFIMIERHYIRLLIQHDGRFGQGQKPQPQPSQIHMPPIHTLRTGQLLHIQLIQDRLKTIRELILLRRLSRWLVPTDLVHDINRLILLFIIPAIHKGLEVILVFVVLDMLPVFLFDELVRLTMFELGFWLP